MLRNTFIHLPGIGPKREQMLWERGILDWDRFLTAAEQGALRARETERVVPLVRQSLDAVGRGDAGYFKPLLPPREAWRLYTEFVDRAVFLDIETTGLSPYCDEVDVANLVELVETAVRLKTRRTAFPGNAAPPERCGPPRPASEDLANWVEEYLESVSLRT